MSSKWTVGYYDKDTGAYAEEPVSGPVGGSQRSEELREEGHDPVGWRESL